ncbi:uncharacterized protein UV8b_03979 [Ustilaginoidea virens]|uniref:Uncharacterized protein n=1 Tax=Ustilaginoidea virens TaxID=1159556 RepID=A0A8E5HQR7_USTVR|nr:uncharacterized protein UV8b_03979 [Ustilaginoidea virens]QUC19738.1 hypothetical protein UV8b_03979 [Ustilaginoidea virens]
MTSNFLSAKANYPLDDAINVQCSALQRGSRWVGGSKISCLTHERSGMEGDGMLERSKLMGRRAVSKAEKFGDRGGSDKVCVDDTSELARLGYFRPKSKRWVWQVTSLKVMKTKR